MANITPQFNCDSNNGDYLTLFQNKSKEIAIALFDINRDELGSIILDIPTAIKLSKTLRAEINKVKEVNNG